MRRRGRGAVLRLAREALRRPGRPRDDQLHPAARLVLLLPLLPAPGLQVAGVGDPRHDRRADDLRAAAAGAAVHRPALRAAAAAPAGGDGRGGARDHLDGRADVEGRDREGVARLGGRPRGAEVGEGAGLREQPDGDRGGEALRRERLRGTATPISARARATSARPISPTSARRPARRPSSSRPTWPTRPTSATT